MEQGQQIPMAMKEHDNGNPMTSYMLNQEMVRGRRQLQEAAHGCIPADDDTCPNLGDGIADNLRDMVPDGGGAVKGMSEFRAH